ncbi:MAG: AMP-binding protein [Streptosporangiaceae bacterium]
MTYQELDELCARDAAGLIEVGVRPGDRVSLYSPNRWEWVVAYHAGLRARAVVNSHQRDADNRGSRLRAGGLRPHRWLP